MRRFAVTFAHPAGALGLVAVATAIACQSTQPTASGSTSTAPAASAPTVASAPPAPTAQPAGPQAVDPIAMRFVNAVNARSLDGIVGSFTADATVSDVGRPIRGSAAIRTWAANEVVGGHLEVIENHPKAGGTDLLVQFAPSGSSGFRAWYRMTFRDGLISVANLEYA